MSRPLFAGSYLQVTWWAAANGREEKTASNDNQSYRRLAGFSESKRNAGSRTLAQHFLLFYFSFFIAICLLFSFP